MGLNAVCEHDVLLTTADATVADPTRQHVTDSVNAVSEQTQPGGDFGCLTIDQCVALETSFKWYEC